jgi:hypothetical protein
MLASKMTTIEIWGQKRNEEKNGRNSQKVHV